MKKKNIFLKQKSVLLGITALRIFIFVICVSLIGTRIFVGGRLIDEDSNMLFDATREGKVDQVKKLLLQGINPDVLDGDRNTPLFFNGLHAFFGDDYRKVMQIILSFYANVNHQNIRGESVFHACVFITKGEILQKIFLTLFSYGGDVDLKDKQGNTFLMVLTAVNSINPVDQLLAMFADVFGVARIEQAKNFALSYGYTDIAEVYDVYLQQLNDNKFVPPSNRGINEIIIRIAHESGKNYLFLSQEKEKVLKARDVFGNSILHYAIMTGNVQLVEFILEYIPELVNIKNNAGSYPIHFLARTDMAIENRKKIATLCKKHKVDFNSIDGSGGSLLLLLLRKKDISFVKYLMKEFGDLIKKNLRDKQGESPREFLERVDKALGSVFSALDSK